VICNLWIDILFLYYKINRKGMKKKTENNNLFSHIYAVTECTKKNCAEEKRKLEAINDKNKDEMVKLMKSDLSHKQFMQKMLAIQKKINKTDEKINLVECQLKKCYQQTHDMVMFSINSIFIHSSFSYSLSGL